MALMTFNATLSEKLGYEGTSPFYKSRWPFASRENGSDTGCVASLLSPRGTLLPLTFGTTPSMPPKAGIVAFLPFERG
ncbi:putative cubilin [Sesbania bispinosa]|nr:putative cubilin [Sesbania bispinosa]